MKKYGFEKEYFILKDKNYILVPPNLPYDDCGFLVEARGEPHSDPLTAAYLLLAEEAKIKSKLPRGTKLGLVDTTTLPVSLIKQALSKFGKNPSNSETGNLYGLEYQPEDNNQRAGLHVHFSDIVDITDKNGDNIQVPKIMDIPKIVRYLDSTFAKEIEAANRIKGSYELKVHGFEYRSLPASIDVCKVAKALIKFNRG